jgi:hypothetical protein
MLAADESPNDAKDNEPQGRFSGKTVNNRRRPLALACEPRKQDNHQ